MSTNEVAFAVLLEVNLCKVLENACVPYRVSQIQIVYQQYLAASENEITANWRRPYKRNPAT